jgi:hypothetical protein
MEIEDGAGEPLCQGLGPVGIMHGRGFWLTISEERRDELVSTIEALMEEVATLEELRDVIAGKLEFGIEPPLFSGSHCGENGGRGHGFKDQR